jgi:hypothetical protein
MAKDASRGDTTRNVGTVRSVRSSVVEMRFPERLPEINAMIRAGEGEIPVETILFRDSKHSRQRSSQRSLFRGGGRRAALPQGGRPDPPGRQQCGRNAGRKHRSFWHLLLFWPASIGIQ